MPVHFLIRPKIILGTIPTRQQKLNSQKTPLTMPVQTRLTSWSHLPKNPPAPPQKPHPQYSSKPDPFLHKNPTSYIPNILQNRGVMFYVRTASPRNNIMIILSIISLKLLLQLHRIYHHQVIGGMHVGAVISNHRDLSIGKRLLIISDRFGFFGDVGGRIFV